MARDTRPVGIVHGPADRALALRVLGDTRSLGVAAVLIPACETARECEAMWARVRGAVFVHTTSSWWPQAQLDDVAARKAAGARIAVAGFDFRRIPPDLHGLPYLQLVDVGLEDGARYAASPDDGTSGHAFIAGFFGRGRDPSGEARRGYVFVSHRSNDVDWVADEIVPALAEQGFGLFDYRATERLDVRTLDKEIDRWLERCAVLLVVATRSWRDSEQTRRELAQARSLGKPVVVLHRTARPGPGAGRVAVRVRFATAEQDGPALAAAIRAAVDPRPS